MRKFGLFFIALATALSSLQSTEIKLWHAFDGLQEETFSSIIADFNNLQSDVHVTAEKKGNYKEVFEKGLEAFKLKENPPHILQVYEVATLSAMLEPQTFKSVHDLMSQYCSSFDPTVYIDVVRNFYSSSQGKMVSLPWNASTGILFYNKDLFAKVGLDPEHSPQTWEELEEMGLKFTAAGLIGFTTAWPAAYHLEHFTCWHNIPFATKNNGFEGLDTELLFNSEGPRMHWAKLAEWQKNGIFSYQGRFTTEPEKLFTDGKCAILLQGSNRLPLLEKEAQFSIGVGKMPYWSKLVEAPFTLGIGGASFWVFENQSDVEYQAVAKFLSFLSETQTQVKWHQKTGYLPITKEAYTVSLEQGFYKDHPAAEIAVLEVMGNAPGLFSQGMRLGNYIQIRDLILDKLEAMLEGKIGPKKALGRAVSGGNRLLKDFEESVASRNSAAIEVKAPEAPLATVEVVNTNKPETLRERLVRTFKERRARK